MSDCIIIGGGLIGMMTARELHQRGLQVTIIERGLIGRESSWAGGGILSTLSPWTAPSEFTSLVDVGQTRYPQICQELFDQTGIDPQYRVTGMLNFDVPALIAFERWRDAQTLPAFWLPAEEIPTQFSQLGEVNAPAIWMPEIAQVRNPRLVKALHAYLLREKIRIIEQTTVQRFIQKGERIQGVETSKGKFHTDQLVVAAGAWSAQFGLTNEQVFPVRGQMLRIDAPDLNLKSILLKDDSYIIPRQDGQLVIGSTVEYCGFDKSTTREAFEHLKMQADRIVPALRDYPVAQQWSGLRPGSINGMPLIQRHPEIEGVFINTGHFRNGVILAPGSSQRLVDLMLNQT